MVTRATRRPARAGARKPRNYYAPAVDSYYAPAVDSTTGLYFSLNDMDAQAGAVLLAGPVLAGVRPRLAEYR